jgi:hypothetical protein
MTFLTGSATLGTSLTYSATLGATGSSSYTSSSWHLLDFLTVASSSKEIRVDLNVMVTWYINPKFLGGLTVSHKYSLIS